MDGGYDGSHCDSGEDDYKLKRGRPSHATARVSKLTKAERLEAERLMQQWSAAAEDDPGEERYDRYDSQYGVDVWG